MSTATSENFGKWRSRLWPVYRHELAKILPMLCMFFFISFNYTIFRDTKDTLIVGRCGAEAIPFLKTYGTVPCAIIFMLIYSKLSNILSKQALFYTTLAPFLIFSALFSTVIYPNQELLKPNETANWLLSVLPAGFAGLAETVRNWPYAIFYILAELWGSVVLSLLFWGFANDITRIKEAKRFYAILGIGANIALIFSGQAIKWAANIKNSIPEGVDEWGYTLNLTMGMVVIAGLAVAYFYWHINKYVLTNPSLYSPEETKKPKKSKQKMSISESLKFLFSSKYMGLMALLVMSYGVAINLVEVTWKGQLKSWYVVDGIFDNNGYQYFMGCFSQFTGLTTSLIILFIGSSVVSGRSWKFAAMVTPIVLLTTGSLFFGFTMFKESLAGYIAVLGTTPLFLAVIIGAAQNILSKGCKYSMFDPTKEMAYIPLDPETKVKGKAAVDVVGARLGKSGGSLIQQGLFLFGTLATVTPYIAGTLLTIVCMWFWVVKSLNKEFLAVSAKKEQEASETTVAEATVKTSTKEAQATA